MAVSSLIFMFDYPVKMSVSNSKMHRTKAHKRTNAIERAAADVPAINMPAAIEKAKFGSITFAN